MNIHGKNGLTRDVVQRIQKTLTTKEAAAKLEAMYDGLKDHLERNNIIKKAMRSYIEAIMDSEDILTGLRILRFKFLVRYSLLISPTKVSVCTPATSTPRTILADLFPSVIQTITKQKPSMLPLNQQLKKLLQLVSRR